MSILIQHFKKFVITNPRFNQVFISNRRTLSLFFSSPLTVMANMNCHHIHTVGTDHGVRNSSFSLKHGSSAVEEIVTEKCDYESAVLKLHSLVSNAEVLAAIKAADREYRRMTHIDNINKFILRSGIKDEDVDKMSIIHVSGTKGKGSTCAFCESILRSKGYKTGLFTSPHLVEVRERIRINGRPVSKEMYAYHFWKVYNRLIAMKEDKDEKLPAYFAFNMILALHIFLSEGVDVSIIEVGIGGQYDSTNFIRKPVVCGMTSLGYDHVSILGNTIEQIAWNKAGIFKNGCPAIVANQPPPAMQVILNRAKERQNAIYQSAPIDKDVLAREGISLGISGNKQADNAGLAVQLTRIWEKRHKASQESFPCNVLEVSSAHEIPVLETTHIDDVTAKGLSSCLWPGRAQTITRPGMSVTYYLDGAHTRESVEVCSQWFKEKADQEMKTVKGKVARVLIFNVTGERKPGPLLECLKGCDFDAAGFCTNSVSTVESFNKKDQINPKYTPKVMIEKTEENRLCWDLLQNDNVSEHCPNLPDLSSASHQNYNGNSFKTAVTSATPTMPDTIPVKKRIIGKTSPSYALSNSTPFDVSYSLSQPSSSAVPFEPSLGIGKMNGTSNLDTENNDKNFSRSCGSPSDSDMLQNSKGDNDISKTSNGNNDNACDTVISSGLDKVYAEKNNNNNNDIMKNPHIEGGQFTNKILYDNLQTNCPSSLGESSCASLPSLSSTPPSSQSFPCVLQALVWATQGRDPLLVIKDGNATLPASPSALVDADHIQVLVTGSLLLVGGVLGVIDPDMNE